MCRKTLGALVLLHGALACWLPVAVAAAAIDPDATSSCVQKKDLSRYMGTYKLIAVKRYGGGLTRRTQAMRYMGTPMVVLSLTRVVVAGHRRIGNAGNERGRNLRTVHLFQMRLDFPHRHPACVQRQYLVVKARPAGLVFGHKLRLKAGEPVARNLDRQFAKFAFEGFFAAAIARIARRIGDGFVLAVPKVFGHLGFKGALNQPLGELL